MSNFADYWNRLVRATPSLQNESVKMSIGVASFKKAVERAYKAGVLSQVPKEELESVAKKFEEIGGKKPSNFGDFGDMFGNMFGGN